MLKIRKRQAMIHGYWYKKFPSIHDRLAHESMLTRNRHTQMGDKRRNHLDPKRPQKEPLLTTTDPLHAYQ